MKKCCAEKVKSALAEAEAVASKKCLEQRDADRIALSFRIDKCTVVVRASMALVATFLVFDALENGIRMIPPAVFVMTCMAGVTTWVGVTLLGRGVKNYLLDGQFWGHFWEPKTERATGLSLVPSPNRRLEKVAGT